MNFSPGDKVEYIGPDNFYVVDPINKDITPPKNTPFTVKACMNGRALRHPTLKDGTMIPCITLVEFLNDPFCYDEAHFHKLNTFQSVLEEVEQNTEELVLT